MNTFVRMLYHKQAIINIAFKYQNSSLMVPNDKKKKYIYI